MASVLQQLITPLIEKAINVPGTGKGLITARFIQIAQLTIIVLELNVWRIANNDVKAILDIEHPFGREKFR